MKRVSLKDNLILIGGTIIITLYALKDHLPLGIFLSGIAIIVITLWNTWTFNKTDSVIFKIDRQPIIPIREITDGIAVAVEGTFKANAKLTAPYSKVQCIYSHSIKQKLVRSNKSSHWITVENITQHVPFTVKDNTGEVEVHLENVDYDFSGHKIKNKGARPDYPNSEVDCQRLLYNDEYEEKYGPFKFLTRKLRKTEYVLLPETRGFVYGKTFKTKNAIGICEDKGVPLIVSRNNKKNYVEEFFKGEKLLHFSNILLAIGFTISYAVAQTYLKLPFWGLLAGNGIIFSHMLIKSYNRFVTLDQRSKNALSEIDIQLQRRTKLIPNVLAATKAIAKHEKKLQKMVANMRQKAVFNTNEKTQADSPKRADKTLFAIIEKYPKLKSKTNFKKLMVTLTDTENRIAHSRAFYNRSVLKYNNLTMQFPFSLIAAISGFEPKKYLNFK
ncbi:MAG: LemA family protein [Candidatus Micrarchaeia archaeon]